MSPTVRRSLDAIVLLLCALFIRVAAQSPSGTLLTFFPLCLCFVSVFNKLEG